jgi:molybdopterin/thiamine biosynthesis adenylyltransferase
VARVQGWLEKTAAGWPDDNDCDLERYIPGTQDPVLVLCDLVELGDVTGCVQVLPTGRGVVRVSPEQRPVPPKTRKGRRRPRSGSLGWVANVGELAQPIVGWTDVAALLDPVDTIALLRLVHEHGLRHLLLRYTRSGTPGTLALVLEAAGNAPGARQASPRVRSSPTADTSVAARRLRSGVGAPELASFRVAIVGCGAVGSAMVDLLFRNGVTRQILLDPDRLRPGNVIRHLADDRHVGLHKVHATRQRLGEVGLVVDDVDARVDAIGSPGSALLLMDEVDAVVDATGDEWTTALLRWAAESTQTTVVSAAVQREGGIARADRFPAPVGDYLPSVPLRTDLPAPGREHGCGDAVSNTPPSAVVAAATLGVELLLAGLSGVSATPASLLRVLEPQPDAPYDRLTMLTSPPAAQDPPVTGAPR